MSLRCLVAGTAIFLGLAPAIAQTPTAPDFSGHSWNWFGIPYRDCWGFLPPRALPLPERDFTRVCAERIPAASTWPPSAVWRQRSAKDVETMCRTMPIQRRAYVYSTMEWSGACEGRLVDGRGILSLPGVTSTNAWTSNSADLSGTFENGVLNGPGRWKSDSGSYEGTLRNGLPHGQGTQDLVGEGHYEGGFYDGHFDGHGVETFANGDMLEGWFVNGRPVGNVVFRPAGGSVLKGRIVLPHPDPAIPIPSLSYPPIVVRLNDDGFAVIAFTVSKDGSMKNIRVKFSTGSERLDNPALDYVSKLHMLPGSIDGHAVEMQGEQGVSFMLLAPIVEGL